MSTESNGPMDYYALLEVDRTAGADEIRVAIRAQRRTWVRRQSSPDPARRTAAEQRIRDLDAAEKTLLDAAARSVYDRRLGSGSPTTVGPNSRSSGETGRGPTGSPRPPRPPRSPRDRREPAGETITKGQWIERAEGFLGDGNPTAARRAAQAALDLGRTDAYAWYLLGSAALLDGNADQAIEELTEALRLDAALPNAHLRLAEAYLDNDQPDRAIRNLQQALAHQPDDPDVKLGLAEAYARSERAAEALPILRGLAEENPTDQGIQRALATTLYSEAMDGLAEYDRGLVVVSSKQVAILDRNHRAITQMEVADDPHVQGLAAQMQEMHDEAKRRIKVPTINLRYYLGAAGMPLAVMMFIQGLAVQVMAALMVAGVVWLYVWRHRPPVWRVRRKELRRELTKRGI